MTAAAVRASSLIPDPRSSGDSAAGGGARSRGDPSAGRAVAYQRVLHQLVRRELRVLADLVTWAPADEAQRTATLTRHAELISRVLLHHHTVERDAVWPTLVRAVPGDRIGELRGALDDWSERCGRIDHLLGDVTTAARHWSVTATAPARDAFAKACRTLADAVEEQTAEEERALLPPLATHLEPDDWAAITHSSRGGLSPGDQLLVLGLALEDCSAGDRARLLGGLPRSARWAWRISGERRYRAAVVRLRGAPPAS
jgi:hypothetical protein